MVPMPIYRGRHKRISRLNLQPAVVPVRGKSPSVLPARRLQKNFSTSRDRSSAVAVRSLDAESTDVAALLVSPRVSLREPMLATKVELPSAANFAFAEISRV